MVKVEKSGLLGRGFNRECYRHPEYDDLCIKVIFSDNFKEFRREKKYYTLLEKRGISWDMLPRYHGDIETNLGPGSVFDLIIDHDGAASKTLEFYLSSSSQTEDNHTHLSNALNALKDYMLRQQIITMTLMPSNILCKREASGEFRLFVVDNIGNSDFIPICNYSGILARMKISRKWKRFEGRLVSTYKHNKALQRMLAMRV